MSFILQGVGDPVQLETMDGVLGGNKTKITPATPAVILMDPRDGYNVGNAQRGCSNWGVNQLWWTGDRVKISDNLGDVLDTERVKDRQSHEEKKFKRLPREERMKGWSDVALINHPRPFDFYKKTKARIIACELVQGAQNLFHYQHPEDAVYVFGPEDGSIPDSIRPLCHEFIMAPTHHCLNLASAVNVVLAFRRYSLIQQGLLEDKPVNDWLQEHRGGY